MDERGHPTNTVEAFKTDETSNSGNVQSGHLSTPADKEELDLHQFKATRPANTLVALEGVAKRTKQQEANQTTKKLTESSPAYPPNSQKLASSQSSRSLSLPKQADVENSIVAQTAKLQHSQSSKRLDIPKNTDLHLVSSQSNSQYDRQVLQNLKKSGDNSSNNTDQSVPTEHPKKSFQDTISVDFERTNLHPEDQSFDEESNERDNNTHNQSEMETVPLTGVINDTEPATIVLNTVPKNEHQPNRQELKADEFAKAILKQLESIKSPTTPTGSMHDREDFVWLVIGGSLLAMQAGAINSICWLQSSNFVSNVTGYFVK